jgi:hypothetical protein
MLFCIGTVAMITTVASIEVCIADFQAGALSPISDARFRQAITFAVAAPLVWLLCWWLACRVLHNGIRLLRVQIEIMVGAN